MHPIPRSGRGDHTLALLTEGYEFITRRCRQLDTDVFETTIQLEPTICLRGEAAAELFYDDERFTRHGAAPARVERTLFGEGGVQGLEGAAHRHRKAMFLSLMTRERLDELGERLVTGWLARLPAWERAERLVLHDEAGRLLTEAVHDWAGVPLDPDVLDRHLAAHRGMIVGAPGLAHRYLWGRVGRAWGERWARDVVTRTRADELSPPEDSALAVVATHRDEHGDLLDPQIAGIELLNVLRPTIANDRYVAFLALALHEHPQWRERLAADGQGELTRAFVQEVRRTAPFFPFVAARVREDLTWRGHHLPKGRRVLLDLFGTNLDARSWPDPTRFRPERHLEGEPSPFALIPQGGGAHDTGHRCAGEWSTIVLLQAAVRCLTRAMHYRLPPQDLSVGRGRIPGLPRSGVVLADVRATGNDPRGAVASATVAS